MRTLRLLFCGVVSFALGAGSGVGQPTSFRVPAARADAVEAPPPSALTLGGWLGGRVEANATNRLVTIDTGPLLAGFQKKPGVHPWIGEHIGKWMHAASLAWANNQDPRLEAKLRSVAADLIAAQEPDGYLGTYVATQRFGLYPGADWDVWSHKYNLMGLLTYYQFTGDPAALVASRRMADLLVATFGPGKKSILAAGTHVGIAATSVLEPMVLLYRFTGEPKYLEFCDYLVQSWDEEGGPAIIRSLLERRQVNRTANAKAYEMLSNLVGLCELARVTGNQAYLEPALVAWEDITRRRLYITGSASQGEHFKEDHELPNHSGANVAETCVTTTWIQFNQQLLRLTGEARFANELEKTYYNHLAAAQQPRGDDWCYFTALEGKKPYSSGINCCHSSGPRGMALAPLQAYLVSRRPGRDTGVLVNTFETSAAELTLESGPVRVVQQSAFPFTGQSEVRFELAGTVRFALGLRVPPWAERFEVRLNGRKLSPEVREGWAWIEARDWAASDQVSLRFPVKPRFVRGTHGNTGLTCLTWGPFVMAFDSALTPGVGNQPLGFVREKAKVRQAVGSRSPQLEAPIRSARWKEANPAVFVPFADAGATGGSYRVWLRSPGAALPQNPSLLASGVEDRSRRGNVEGSINDGDSATFVVTFDGTLKSEDWYSVSLEEPAAISRVVFLGGSLFHDGGWFDTAGGKPKIQVQARKGVPWETVAELTDYPETTSTDPGQLRNEPRRPFMARWDSPVRAVAVRVIGTPASGDNPKQAFSSCAELQAFEK